MSPPLQPPIPVELPGARAHFAHVVEQLMDVRIRALLPAGLLPRRIALVTDVNVEQLHGAAVRAWLARDALAPVMTSVLEPGEGAKNFAAAQELIGEFAGARLERGDLVLALGGGVVGDLAGFAASVYRRGIGVAQLPTTLLAQVDSCLGGKTGVDLPEGKNLAGTIHQPRFILVATAFLGTLPPRHFRAGLAEAIKLGILYDEELFEWIAARAPRQAAALSSEERGWLVRRCLTHKARVVAADEFDLGGRLLLNFGHTLGHALETATNYSEALYHGEAVAIGMVAACRLAEMREGTDPGVRKRVEAVLRACELPIAVPAALDRERIKAAVSHDKKSRAGRLRFILPVRIGECVIDEEVTAEEFARVLHA